MPENDGNLSHGNTNSVKHLKACSEAICCASQHHPHKAQSKARYNSDSHSQCDAFYESNRELEFATTRQAYDEGLHP